MIMISVLKSGDSRDVFRYFDDFDEYSYNAYTEAPPEFARGPNSQGMGGWSSTGSSADIEINNSPKIQEWRKKVKYEVLGGYIMVLRGIDRDDLNSGVKLDRPDFSGIQDDAGCHLIGKTKANLYPGTMGGRQSYHIIGDENLVIKGLHDAISNYFRVNKDGSISGTARDLNACLKCLGKRVF